MASTAFWSPAHRVLQRLPSADAGLPYNASPSLDYLGNGLQDHRLRYNVANSATGFQAVGWFGANPVFALNLVPSAISAVNIAAAALAVTTVPITLVSASGAGITVLTTAAGATLWPSLTALTAGLVIDSIPNPLAFGSKARTGCYDRSKMGARNIRITSAGGDDTGCVFTVRGYDVYGYAMSEAITGANAGVASGKKAFKVVTSITPVGTVGSTTVSVGTGDVFGLPIQCPLWGDMQVHWNSVLITAATGFVVPDVTTPATTTTGDVRGTYAVQSTASDGTRTLQVKIFPSLALCNTNPTIGLFGVAQV